MSKRFRETNDCAVVALSEALEIPYETVHQVLKKNGRQNRTGTTIQNILTSVRELGYNVINQNEHILRLYSLYNIKSKPRTTDFLRYQDVWRQVSGNYLALTRNHIFAIIDGKNDDWTNHISCRIESIYKVEKRNV